jgi:bacillolysin
MTCYRRFFAGCLLLGFASSIAFAAPGGSAGATPTKFLSLTGDEARAFVIPSDLKLEHSEMLANQNLTRERYQQYWGRAKVLGGQVTLYRDPTGTSTLVIGSYYLNINPSNSVALAPDEVRRTVEREIGVEGRWQVDLLIDPKTSRFFYRVENRRFDSRKFYSIDAENGDVLRKHDGLTTGQGTGVKGDSKDLTGLTTFNGAAYELRATDGRQITHDARNRPRHTDLGNSFPVLGVIFRALILPGLLATDPDDQWVEPGSTSPGQAALVDASYYARVTDLYYQTVHGRNSLDNAGLPIVSTAHYSKNYNNAFWNNGQLVYGDGDGASFREFSGALDVVAHELTHGVTEFTSNLIYFNESGALNEAFSDIMGSSVEFFATAQGLDPTVSADWLMGEDVTLDAGGMRNMADPAEAGDPDHYSERQVDGGDNGGVHSNSGIPNHAYYLLVNGGSNAGEARGHPHTGPVVAGIGLATAEQIFYLAFIGLPEDATMCNARLATVAVATALFPSTVTSVSNAWEAVGVPDNC